MAKKQSSTSGLVAALEIASATDAGKVRSNNEDSVLANATAGLAVLADGMGGYNAGEVASGMATMMLGADLEKDFAATPPSLKTAEGYRAHQVLTRRIQEVNAAIYQAATTQMQYSGMGTTLVAAVFHDNHVSVAHLGDSRMYRLREGQLAQITKDHSLLQEQMDLGIITPAQAKQSMNKNLVTRGLGVEGPVDPEIHDHAVKVGDIYLLCSDGLTDMVEDEEIGLALSMLAANLPLCAQQLVQMANDSGGRDNTSVILVKVKQAFPASVSWCNRLLALFGFK